MAAKKKFNVGDKVRIINKSKYFKNKYGKIGTITNTDSIDKRLYYTVVFDDETDSSGYYCLVSDIELVCRYDEITPKSNPKSSPKVTTITDEQLNRMHTEFTELGERADKLEKFINGPSFISVDEQSKTELMVQLDAMKIYYRVLVSRYNRLLSSKTNVVLYMD